MPKKRTPLEHQEEGTLSDVLDIARLFHFHIPNEHGPRIGRLLKMGYRPGASDHFIGSPVPRKPKIRGVFIELKREDGDEPTDNQKEFLAEAEVNGYFVITAYGAEDAIAQLTALGYDLRLA